MTTTDRGLDELDESALFALFSAIASRDHLRACELLAALLIAQGAAVRARNRRGSEPLHYAADGLPGGDDWDPDAQRELISDLIDAGADPDAIDKSGVAPVHRAVRTRSSGATTATTSRRSACRS